MMDSQDWEPPTEAEMKLIEARRERSDRISKLMGGYLLKGYKMLGVVCPECETILLQDRQGVKYCVACSELDSDTDKDNPLTNQSAAKSMIKEIERSANEPKLTGATKTASKGLSQHIPSQAVLETERPRIFSSSGEVVPATSAASLGAKNWPLRLDYGLKEEDGAATSSELYTKQQNVIRETDSDSGISSLTETHTLSHQQHRKRQANTSSHNVMPVMLEPVSMMMPVANLLEKIDWASKELKDTASVEYSIHLCQLIKAAAEAVVAVRSARM